MHMMLTHEAVWIADEPSDIRCPVGQQPTEPSEQEQSHREAGDADEDDSEALAERRMVGRRNGLFVAKDVRQPWGEHDHEQDQPQ